jgi:phosphatidylinositol glycan class V
MLLGGLSRWDSEYFIHISIFGYEFDRLVAFYPGWPYLMSHVGFIFWMGGCILNPRSAALVAGTLLNFAMSVAATDALYRLTRTVVGKELAFYAAVMFCATPATITFSALYSESLYTWVTFEALYFLYK